MKIAPPLVITEEAILESTAVLAEGLAETDAIARANLYAAMSTTGVGTQKSFPRRADFEVQWTRRHSEAR